MTATGIWKGGDDGFLPAASRPAGFEIAETMGNRRCALEGFHYHGFSYQRKKSAGLVRQSGRLPKMDADAAPPRIRTGREELMQSICNARSKKMKNPSKHSGFKGF